MKKRWVILIAVIIIALIIIPLIAFDQKNNNSDKRCYAVWEGKHTDSEEGISAHANFQGDCNVRETKEDCENSIDIVNYSIARDSFHEGGDGLPDCEWR